MENQPKVISFWTIIIFISLSISNNMYAQTDTSEYKPEYLDAIVTEDDTIYLDYMDEVVLYDYAPLDSETQRKYYKLRKKVLKVYPYALEASNLFLEVNDKYQTLEKRRKKKKYTRKQQKWLEENFGEELRNLKRSEGRILIKLLHRNLQITAYDLIKFYRNGTKAWIWQRLAKLYDADLKSEYHPETIEDDKIIEMIIQKAIRDGIIEESKLSPYQVVKIEK